MHPYNFNLESYEITKLIDKYEGETFDKLFPNHHITKNKMGQFTELHWDIEEIPCNLDLTITRRHLIRNLKTVYYVGEHTEKKLRKRGIRTLHDLKNNLRYGKAASKIITHIKKRDYLTLSQNNYVYDLDVSFCFEPEDLLFLDIETLGLYDSPIIIIGLGFFEDDKFKIRLLFASELEDEIALCHYFKEELLPNYKTFITYNGKSFDIPYLANRLLYYFDENPMISEEDLPYETTNTLFHHIDLYHNCRRKFKGKFSDYTLTTMEQELLGWQRGNELPSHLVSVCYKKYQANPERYIGLIKECIEHNYYDIYSMPLIYKKLLE